MSMAIVGVAEVKGILVIGRRSMANLAVVNLQSYGAAESSLQL